MDPRGFWLKSWLGKLMASNDQTTWTRRGGWLSLVGVILAAAGLWLASYESKQADHQLQDENLESRFVLHQGEREQWTNLLRRHCTDGLIDSNERDEARAEAKRRLHGQPSERLQTLIDRADGSGRLYPESLDAFVSSEWERLCKAGTLVREGRRLFADSKFDEAREKFLEATRIDAGNVDAQVNLGSTYLQLGRSKDALPYFQTAESLAPSNPPTRFALKYAYGGCLASLTGRELEAIESLREALDVYASAQLDSPDVEYLRSDLRTSSEFRQVRGRPDFQALLRHPALAGLRSHGGSAP